jgi:hypothetical protein
VKKSIALATIALLFPALVAGQAATTNDGYTVCRSKQWIDDVNSFVAARDRGSFRAYFDTNKCVVVREGLKITVVDVIGFLGTQVEFIFNGVRFWAPTEAIKFD